ncbi:DUF7546 family protein [Halobaculum gomorrense]|uniref:Uncharacterized protein n=1 Tax=Halobaculum gomorrense TaxID=43928 RepID=A0A1M5NY79_9EURY|nr:hypothetical protein [Halobaculum gomorrense]SHG94427.1 hypothetical protein SAMN05443636_1387 [Halobaculum gomorrense]
MNRLPTRFTVDPPAAYARTAVFALGAQSALALAYLVATDAGLAAPRTLAIPFVWITVAAVGVRHADRPASSRSVLALAGLVGAGYAIVLGWFTGTVGLSSGAAAGLDVVLLPPWWGPMVRFDGAVVSLFLFPYRVVGYAALAYLVSLAVRDVAAYGASAGVGGVIALGSCASCALPVVAAVASAVGGAGVGLGAAPAAAGGTYLIATVAYVLSVAVLTVRPSAAG